MPLERVFVDPSKYFKRVSLNPGYPSGYTRHKRRGKGDILYIKESIIAATSTSALQCGGPEEVTSCASGKKEREKGKGGKRMSERESSKSQLNVHSVYFRLDGNKRATEISYGFGISTKSVPTLSRVTRDATFDLD